MTTAFHAMRGEGDDDDDDDDSFVIFIVIILRAVATQ